MEFENVSVVKKANIYFEGKVTSRTVLFADGERKTLGIMLAGETEYTLYTEGQSYVVPANSSFKMVVVV